jgi:hypothetical protein
MILHDHIAIFPNSIPDDLCDECIGFFEHVHEAGFSVDRQINDRVGKILKDDTAVFMASVDIQFSNYRLSWELKHFLMQNAYNIYARKYDILNDLDQHDIYDIKLQKTEIGQGYHVWHCEQTTRVNCKRLMAFTAYLNTVDEGGETEFLYQSKRIKAEKGTVVLFPASYTHTHRGNPPISNTKYIATGWIEF